MDEKMEKKKNDIIAMLEKATLEEIDLAWRFLHTMLQ